MPDSIFGHKNTTVDMFPLTLDSWNSKCYKLSTANQSVMFYNVNVHTQTRGPDPDLVVRESFLVEVTCKLRPEG